LVETHRRASHGTNKQKTHGGASLRFYHLMDNFDIKVIAIFISSIAMCISILSFCYTRKHWLSTYRPIITAEIKIFNNSVGAAKFNLVIYNSGNRPAINISLKVEKEDLKKILSKNVSAEHEKELFDIFSPSNTISLIVNDKTATTAFFSFSDHQKNIDILKYHAKLPICIEYEDISQRKYKQKIELYIRDSEGFGGSIWKKS